MPSNRFRATFWAFVLVAGAASAQTDVVGRISAFKAAKVSASPLARGSYVVPGANQSVKNGDGVRTDRRGFAQITFNDRSALRLSELTELIVQDAISLRRLQLSRGAIWTRVTKGSNTSVQTPVATATVRGTEFLMDSDGNLAVREGIVDLEAGGFTIEVKAGEVAGVKNGRPYKKGVQITTDDEVVVEEQGIPAAWTRALRAEMRGKDHNELLALAAIPLLIFGAQSSGNRNSSVPEPATLLVLAAGVSAAAAVRRDKRGNR